MIKTLNFMGLSVILSSCLFGFAAILSSSVSWAVPLRKGDTSAQIELAQHMHSHNDYEQRMALHHAMQLGYTSIEVDLFLQGGELMVSHRGFFSKGTLENVYLKQLQMIVDRRGGSVYGDGRPFLLWIEPKRNSPQLMNEIARVLAKYPMITRYVDDVPQPGAITVILAGDATTRIDYVNRERVRYASRDATFTGADDPVGNTRWDWYVLSWSDWMYDAGKLKHLMDHVHSKGRKLRLVSVPEKDHVFRIALAAGVDLIGTDNLARLRRTTDSVASEQR